MSFPIEREDGTIGFAVDELPEGSEYLVAWISMNLGSQTDINIYGNPKGLRALAAKLIEIADFNQSSGEFPEDDSLHRHFSTGCNTETSAPRLTIGRVDAKNDPTKLRDCFPRRVPEFSSDKCIQ